MQDKTSNAYSTLLSLTKQLHPHPSFLHYQSLSSPINTSPRSFSRRYIYVLSCHRFQKKHTDTHKDRAPSFPADATPQLDSLHQQLSLLFIHHHHHHNHNQKNILSIHNEQARCPQPPGVSFIPLFIYLQSVHQPMRITQCDPTMSATDPSIRRKSEKRHTPCPQEAEQRLDKAISIQAQ